MENIQITRRLGAEIKVETTLFVSLSFSRAIAAHS